MRALVLGLTVMAAAPVAAQAVDGKRLYIARCAACHVDPAAAAQRQGVGPSLRGVMGRRAAMNPAFRRYSAALRQSNIVWNDRTMDAYLENPRRLVPGTTMAFAGLRAPRERAAIIAYMKNPK